MNSAASSITIVEPEHADLHLWVSNQSYLDDPVVLTIDIDGQLVTSQPFEVKHQHHWVLFPLEIPAGSHIVHVVSDTGVTRTQPFTLPAGLRRYAVIDYWNDADEDGRQITWDLSTQPIGFR